MIQREPACKHGGDRKRKLNNPTHKTHDCGVTFTLRRIEMDRQD